MTIVARAFEEYILSVYLYFGSSENLVIVSRRHLPLCAALTSYVFF